MTKKKVSIKKPPWDLGTGTLAASSMTVIEDAVTVDPETGKAENPNNAKRRRRICWIEHYHNKGQLTKDQFIALEQLQKAYEATQKTPPKYTGVNVDSSPKPDMHVDVLISRIGNFHKYYSTVPQAFRPFISHVVLENRPIGAMPNAKGRRVGRYMEKLKQGAQFIADSLK